MRILLAVSDRDLLECYQKILDTEFKDIITAFDGTQVLALLEEDRFDMVILDRDIPRVDYRIILQKLNNRHISAIVLLTDPADERQIAEATYADAVLSHPFDPEDMISIIFSVADQKQSTEKIRMGGQA